MTTSVPDPRPLRVLIVDEDADAAAGLRRVLAQVPGVAIVSDWAPGLASGVSRVRFGDYDLCLVDDDVSGADGRTWIDSVRDIDVQLPTILLCSASTEAAATDDAGERREPGLLRLARERLTPEQLGACLRRTLELATARAATLQASAFVAPALRSPAPIGAPDTMRAMGAEVDAGDPAAQAEPDTSPRREDPRSRAATAAASRWLESDDATADPAPPWAETRLRLLEHALGSSPDAVLIVAAEGERRVLYVNRAFETISGYAPREVIGRPGAGFLGDPRRAAAELDPLAAPLQPGERRQASLQMHRKDGSTFWAQLAISPVQDGAGRITHLVASIEDVSERHTFERELAYLANRDPVTGLPLLQAQEPRLAAARAAADARARHVAFVVLEVDRFEHIVESMGPIIGDAVLRAVGSRLRAVVPEAAAVSRLTSDAFLIALPDVADAADALRVTEQLRAAVEPALPMDPYTLHLTCTAGIALHPEHGSDTQTLLHSAEMALSRGRRSGRGAIVPFLPEFADQLRDRFALGAKLSDALIGNEFVLHFQPQISALDGRVLGLEALLRWQSREHGLIQPARFLATAQELGLMIPLGRWVVRAACLQLREWARLGFEDFHVGINLAAQQLLRPEFLGDICAVAREMEVSPQRIELELTENTLADDMDQARYTMRKLKDAGFRLALDDFGTGYSSLNHLRRLPLDKLKIDRSFVAEVSTMQGDAAIVRAIIAMGRQLQLKVLAEGIESEAQLAFLRRNHCDEFQGHFFSRAVDAHGALSVLQHRYLKPQAFEATQPSRTLLLVDDEENVLRSLTRLLRRDGYQLLTARSADEALAALARHDVQVILSDQRMPGMSGIDFLDRVKHQYPDTMRLVLSGQADLTTVTDAINRGAIYRFITKPWDDAELRESIHAAFRACESLRQAT